MQGQQEAQEQELLTELGGNDVLLGRGSGSNEFPGNKRFRKTVREVLEKSLKLDQQGDATAVHPETREWIAIKVMEIINSRKGRFVVRLAVPEASSRTRSTRKASCIYRVVGEKEALHKTRAAIRFQFDKILGKVNPTATKIPWTKDSKKSSLQQTKTSNVADERPQGENMNSSSGLPALQELLSAQDESSPVSPHRAAALIGNPPHRDNTVSQRLRTTASLRDTNSSLLTGPSQLGLEEHLRQVARPLQTGQFANQLRTEPAATQPASLTHQTLPHDALLHYNDALMISEAELLRRRALVTTLRSQANAPLVNLHTYKQLLAYQQEKLVETARLVEALSSSHSTPDEQFVQAMQQKLHLARNASAPQILGSMRSANRTMDLDAQASSSSTPLRSGGTTTSSPRGSVLSTSGKVYPQTLKSPNEPSTQLNEAALLLRGGNWPHSAFIQATSGVPGGPGNSSSQSDLLEQHLMAALRLSRERPALAATNLRGIVDHAALPMGMLPENWPSQLIAPSPRPTALETLSSIQDPRLLLGGLFHRRDYQSRVAQEEKSSTNCNPKTNTASAAVNRSGEKAVPSSFDSGHDGGDLRKIDTNEKARKATLSHPLHGNQKSQIHVDQNREEASSFVPS